MPWQSEAMKDVLICDKRWKRDMNRNWRFPNGEASVIRHTIIN